MFRHLIINSWPPSIILGCMMGALWSVFGCPLARAYTPESSEVQQMIRKATDYLQKTTQTVHGGGEDVLVGMALYKAGLDTSNGRVKKGIEAACRMAGSRGEGGSENSIYAPALACIFLCEVGPQKYRAEIHSLANEIIRRQFENGCWSYANHPYDDTSQTQYGVLCLWEAHHAGVPVPVESVERAAAWFVKTRHPQGGWAYRPPVNSDNRPGTSMASHNQVSHSCTAAGVGSLYMCAHLLGLGASANEKENDGLPPGVTKVEKPNENQGEFLKPKRTTRQTLAPGIASGNAWFSKYFTYDVGWWTHYYMYAFERYKSFQEEVEGKKVKEPGWYNQGVEFLKKTQKQDGSWKSQNSPTSAATIDTAFAILFLTRSSQKTIQKAVMEEGILIGGKGLPKNTTNITMQGGQVVTPQMIQDVDELLKLLEDADNSDFDPDALAGGFTLDQDLTKRTNQLERLRELVTDEKYEKRLAAVKMLARARDLDNVPALIYALDDPAPQVAREARDGLRFISRKFQGFGMPVPATKQQAQAAQAKWSEWYLSIRPNGELMH